MSDISISRSNTEHIISQLISQIQTEIINGAETSGKRVVNTVEHSAGDFMDSLREELEKETAVISAAGELLIAMAEYIRSASHSFANVDTTYNSSRVR